MTRTPDEIKKGLEYISIKDVARKLDAWEDGIPYDYVEDAAADAIALIQQLQDDNAQLNRCIENMTDKLNAMNDEVAKLQAERDAAVEALKNGDVCEACKHFGALMNEEPCASCSILHSNFKWRGVQKEGGNEATR